MSVASHVVSVGKLSVLFVMATEQEHGRALRGAVAPLMTGVGPVEAAAAVGGALGALGEAGRLPDLVFSLGSAGSRTLEHAAVYQVASVSYRDMDAWPLGFDKGVTPFLGAPATIVIPHRIEGIPAASLSTGGAIISGGRYDSIDADMVDMETYAVLRSARRFGVPTIGLRGISDGRGELTGLYDWTEYLHEIDGKLAAGVATFSIAVESGRFTL
jgi:adenosylhomocysteine nucleosidase